MMKQDMLEALNIDPIDLPYLLATGRVYYLHGEADTNFYIGGAGPDGAEYGPGIHWEIDAGNIVVSDTRTGQVVCELGCEADGEPHPFHDGEVYCRFMWLFYDDEAAHLFLPVGEEPDDIDNKERLLADFLR